MDARQAALFQQCFGKVRRLTASLSRLPLVSTSTSAIAEAYSSSGRCYVADDQPNFRREATYFAYQAMRVDLFDFELPRELIADRPAEPREAARLLVVGKTLEDRHVRDLPRLLRPGDLLVFNDTKVLPARLVGRRGEATVEITLHKETAPGTWRAFAKNARRLRTGDQIVFAPDLEGEVAAREGGEIELRFNLVGPAFRAVLERYGAMPLPPTSHGRAGAIRATARTTRRSSPRRKARSPRPRRGCTSRRRCSRRSRRGESNG